MMGDVQDFIRRFEKIVERRGISIGHAEHGRNSVEVSGQASGLLSIHVFNVEKGFWGVAGNVLARFRKRRLPWALVLLHGSSDHGFLISETVAEGLIRSEAWTRQEKDGAHFKVNPPHGLQGSFEFRSIEEVFGMLQVLWPPDGSKE